MGDTKLLFDKRKFTVTMTIELEAIEDIQLEINSQIDAFLKVQDWQRSDCSIDLLHEYRMLTVNDDPVEDQKNMVEAILKLKKRRDQEIYPNTYHQ